MNRQDILKECGERIDMADQMVTHYDTLGHDQDKRYMQIECKKWEYLYGLVEKDINEFEEEPDFEPEESIDEEEFSP